MFEHLIARNSCPKEKMKTPAQALSALAALCSRGEQAESDLREKLRKWEFAPAEVERIIRRLKDENFLSEERYARAFVRDTFRFHFFFGTRVSSN